MTRAYIVRHGQTDWNVIGRLQGSTDIPLNATGHEQARAVAEVLATLVSGPVRIVSSPLQRARNTAQYLAEALDVPIRLDHRLVERAYGAWEGHTMDDIGQRWPIEFAARAAGEPFTVEGMESDEATGVRVAESICHHTADAPHDVVFFTHGSAARMGVTSLVGFPPVGRAIGNIANTAWSVVSRGDSGQWILERHSVTVGDVRGGS